MGQSLSDLLYISKQNKTKANQKKKKKKKKKKKNTLLYIKAKQDIGKFRKTR